MRILLVKPPLISDAVQPSLGLASLAASLPAEHEVAILDGVLGPFSGPQLARRLLDRRPDLIGFQCLTADVRTVRALAGIVRRSLPDAAVVVGGPHPSALDDGGLSELGPEVDFAFRGEAEPGLPGLVAALAAGDRSARRLSRIPGLVYRGPDNRVRANAPRRADLNRLPLPRWDLVQPERYPPSPNAAFFERWPCAPIVTSRGCPYDCAFCAASTVAGRKVRYRPLDSVLDEIALLRSRGVREIHLEDDNFTFDRDYALGFTEAVARRFPGLSWACPNGARLQSLDDELLALMRRGGCHSIGLGIESGSQRILERIGKGQSLEEVRQAVHRVHRAGIGAVGFFILGLPGETRDDVEATIRLALELPLRRANFMLFSPFPGTRLWTELGESRADPMAKSFAEVGHVPEGWTAAELKTAQRRAFLRFYLRPRAAASLIADVRSVRHAYWIGRRMLRWMVPQPWP